MSSSLRAVLIGSVTVALLSACAGGGVAPSSAAVTPSGSTGLHAQATSGGPTVYAESLNAAGKPFVAVFANGGASFSRKIQHGASLAVDDSGRLYIAHEPVTVYSDAGKTLVQKFRVTNGPRELVYGDAITADGLGDFYVECGHRLVCEYKIGKQGAIRELSVGRFSAIATDSSGNLYLAVDNKVLVYSPGSTSPQRTITSGVVGPEALTVDPQGNLYVANTSAGTNATPDIAVYGPGDSSPTRTISQGITNPVMLRTDSSGNLGVLNFTNIAMYASGSNSPSNLITQGIAGAASMAFDQSNNLYVANVGATNSDPGSITVYSAGTYSLTRTITKNIKRSVSVVVGP